MYSELEIIRVRSIYKKLSAIFTIVDRHGSITQALQDDIEGQPAILMQLVATAEQFNKLVQSNAKVLAKFDPLDVKGMIGVRNFIAHDYDGINLAVVEDSLRYGIPEIHSICHLILEEIVASQPK